MKIGGLQKYSFIDYPGCISSVVFAVGCNFHCPYCHNPELVRPDYGSPAGPIFEVDVFSFLEKRKKYLDGVVITGGEPTLQPDLLQFCSKVKMLGLSVKLDTNGSNPLVLKALINSGLVDYLAMDVKTAPDRYAPLISTDINPDKIRESIELVLHSGLPHEFRTTCIKPITDVDAFYALSGLVRGADLYALQAPRLEKVLDQSFFSHNQWETSLDELRLFQTILSASVKRCIIR